MPTERFRLQTRERAGYLVFRGKNVTRDYQEYWRTIAVCDEREPLERVQGWQPGITRIVEQNEKQEPQ